MGSQILGRLLGEKAAVIQALCLPRLPSFPLFSLHVSVMTLNNPRSLSVLVKSVQQLLIEPFLGARLCRGYEDSQDCLSLGDVLARGRREGTLDIKPDRSLPCAIEIEKDQTWGLQRVFPQVQRSWGPLRLPGAHENVFLSFKIWRKKKSII